MSLTIDPTLAHNKNFETIALIGFAALLAQNNPDFADLTALPTVGPAVAEMSGWCIQMVLGVSPNLQFGQYGNCSPMRRCPNCKTACPAEPAAIGLSQRSAGRPAVLVEANSLSAPTARVTVSTYVPGQPNHSGVWIPTLCPVTHRLLLVATDGQRIAQVRKDGRVATSLIPPRPQQAAINAAMFCTIWRLLSPLPPLPAPAAALAVSVGQ